MAIIRKRTWTTKSKVEKTAWIVDFVDKDGVRGRRQFSRRSKADKFRIELEESLKKGLTTLSLKSPLADVADEYLKSCAQRVEEGSMTKHNFVVYEGHVRNYIIPDPKRHAKGRMPSRMKKIREGMGELKAGEVARSDVTGFRDQLRDAGVSVQTTRKILSTLRQICAFSIEKGLMVANPADEVRVIGRRDEAYRKVTIPPAESVRRVLDAAHPEMRIRLLFAAATGVRAGELHALTWQQIDCTRGIVTIDRRIDVYGVVEVTKTVAGMREIPMGQRLAAALDEWRKKLQRASPDDLVFADTSGDPLRHDVMIKRWYNPIFSSLKKVHAEDPIRNAPPPKRFRWHDLRHFAISSWIAAGLPPKAIQTFAGHSSLQVTMDRYGHLFPDDKHHAAMSTALDRLHG
ncbi:tyrosine-type recombinase/integrase [Pseudochelatococcus lubricantis]|uniref:tyrosine-type recombinase/integrase n=1 Tax=Pseudochelatococcus lubricantis TaxID=1538102 RepID=UPI0035EFE9FB